MGRTASKSTAVLISGVLYTNDEWTGTRMDAPEWARWLELRRSFYVKIDASRGGFTVRAQTRRKITFWYAVKKVDGKVRSIYLGQAPGAERLRQLVETLV